MTKLLLPSALALGLLVSACGGAPHCDDLKKLCESCPSATGKSQCFRDYASYTAAGGVADSVCKSIVEARTYEATAGSACFTSPNCDALKKQCDACTNTIAKSSCNTAYNTYTGTAVADGVGEAACKAVIDAKAYESTSTSCRAP